MLWFLVFLVLVLWFKPNYLEDAALFLNSGRRGVISEMMVFPPQPLIAGIPGVSYCLALHRAFLDSVGPESSALHTVCCTCGVESHAVLDSFFFLFFLFVLVF